MKRSFVVVCILSLLGSFQASAQLSEGMKGDWEGEFVVFNNGKNYKGSIKMDLTFGNKREIHKERYWLDIRNFSDSKRKQINVLEVTYPERLQENQAWFEFKIPTDNREGIAWGKYELHLLPNNSSAGFIQLTFAGREVKTNEEIYGIGIMCRNDDYKARKKSLSYYVDFERIVQQYSDLLIDKGKFRGESLLSLPGNKEALSSRNHVSSDIPEQVAVAPAVNTKPADRRDAPKVQNAQEPLYTLSPDIVYVDADEIAWLNNNVCVVKKGNLEALVNMKGEFVVPYGKYSYYTPHSPPPYIKLMGVYAPVEDPLKVEVGYIDSRGKMVISFEGDYRRFRRSFYDYNYHPRVIETPSGFVDFSNRPIPALDKIKNTWGTSVNLSGSSADWWEKDYEIKFIPASKEVTLESGVKGTKYGGFFPDGSLAIPFIYDVWLGNMTDGFICAGKVDKFGKLQYGFIDKYGKTVIPFQFSNKPENFHEGLALVKPQNPVDFDYAYIDKSGNIKIKIGDGTGRSWKTTSESYFQNGYAILQYTNYTGPSGGTRFIDKNGQIFTTPEMLGDTKTENVGYKGMNEKGIYFDQPRKNSLWNTIGFADFNKQILFLPKFASLIIDRNGENALAIVNLPDTPQLKRQSLKGIINRKGEFILLPKKPGMW